MALNREGAGQLPPPVGAWSNRLPPQTIAGTISKPPTNNNPSSPRHLPPTFPFIHRRLNTGGLFPFTATKHALIYNRATTRRRTNQRTYPLRCVAPVPPTARLLEKEGFETRWTRKARMGSSGTAVMTLLRLIPRLLGVASLRPRSLRSGTRGGRRK